jgi:hypothetical protein
VPRLCGSATPADSALARRERLAVLCCRLAAPHHEGTDCSTATSAQVIACNPGQITIATARDRTRVICSAPRLGSDDRGRLDSLRAGIPR